MSATVACAGVSLGLALSAPALAQPETEASEPAPPPPAAAGAAPAVDGDALQLLDEAKRLYESARYAEALEMFERVYALSPNPAVLFNIGAVHAALHHCELARDAYRRYIEETRLDSGRADAEQQLERLNECESTAPPVVPAAGPEGAASPALPSELAPGVSPEVSPTPDAITASVPEPPPPAPVPSSGMPPLMLSDSAPNGLRIAGWAALGAGGVLGLASLGCVYASSRADDADSSAAPGQTGDAAAREQDAGRRYNSLAWGFAGGAAALAGSGLLLLWLHPDEETSVQVASEAGGLGLSLERRF